MERVPEPLSAVRSHATHLSAEIHVTARQESCKVGGEVVASRLQLIELFIDDRKQVKALAYRSGMLG